jgi:hypothetical protein
MLGRMPARVAVVLLVFAGAWTAYQWWTSPERQIRRILDAVVSALNHDQPESGLVGLGAVAALQQHLAADVSVDTGSPTGPVTGRQDVISLAARLRAGTPMLRIQFFDADISLHSDTAATLRATMQVTTRSESGDDIADVYQVSATLQKSAGQWVVTTARTSRDREPKL